MAVYCPVLQVRSGCLIRYSYRIYGSARQAEAVKIPSTSVLANPFEGHTTYAGVVTKGAQKRIAKAVSLLIQASPDREIFNPVTGKKQKFKISFITLTVASNNNLTAKEAYKQLLEPFLLVARRKWGVKSYVWKAELQKRGQIHYHITTNSFIHLQQIRDTWNNLQNKAGLLDDYIAAHGHANPNSTDVHSVYKVNNIEAYLVKYLSKSEAGKSTIGKVWDCSQNLKKLNYYSIEETAEVYSKIEELKEKGEVKSLVRDFCEIILLQDVGIGKVLTGYGMKGLESHLLNVRVSG